MSCDITAWDNKYPLGLEIRVALGQGGSAAGYVGLDVIDLPPEPLQLRLSASVQHVGLNFTKHVTHDIMEIKTMLNQVREL